MTIGYIYLLREREYIYRKLEVYKVGRSAQEYSERIKDYPKGSEVKLLTRCNNNIETEKKIIDLFKTNFKKFPDGNERFEGDWRMMRTMINSVIDDEPELIINQEETEEEKKGLDFKSSEELFFLSFVIHTLESCQDKLENTNLIMGLKQKDRYKIIRNYATDDGDATDDRDKKGLKGFITLHGTEFFGYYEEWLKSQDNRENFAANPGILGRVIKDRVINKTFNLNREYVCPNQRSTTSNYEYTYWNIYALRDYFNQQYNYTIEEFNKIQCSDEHYSVKEYLNMLKKIKQT